MSLAHSYAAIVKMDKNPDGTLRVYGKATDDSLDIDKQICDEGWLRKAMPDWFETGGNIREQHSNIAAGVATDYELKSDGHYITALVVDINSVKKVETGVLKGFSIGIRSPRVIRDEKALGGRIIDGQIVEVSLVDRPANPNAKLMLAKAADGGELMAVKQSVPSPADLARIVNKDAIPASLVPEEIEAPAEVEAPVEAPAVDEPLEAAIDAEAPIVGAEPELAPSDNLEATEGKSVTTRLSRAQLIEEAEKAANTIAEIQKFDQDLFETAMKAIAGLINVEGTEAGEGSDESDSIHHLLKALKHLKKWYRGEVAEGEVMDPNPALIPEDDDEMGDTGIYLAADSGEMCDKCGKAADECMCATDKCDKCDKIMKECKCAGEKSVSISFDDGQIQAVIEKAVSTAKASVAEEIELLKAALEAAEGDKARIADELATAQKAVVGGGPKRAVTSKPETQTNQLLAKAADLRQKAATTLDSDLRKGYKEWADDLEAKASRKDVK